MTAMIVRTRTALSSSFLRVRARAAIAMMSIAKNIIQSGEKMAIIGKPPLSTN